MTEIITRSPEETENFAEKLAEKFSGGEIVAFRGSMGMGKTCFTRGLARGLGFEGSVTSPTFALVNEYIGGRLPLYHFDMYRVSGWEDLYSTGYFEYMEDGGVLAIEWSENIADFFYDNNITITFEKLGETTRKITVEGVDCNW